jgi:excisionase family DNA binding protein
MATAEPLPLSAKQVAARLGVSPKQVRHWVRDGTLPAWRIGGGHWRIEPAALEAMRAGASGDPESAVLEPRDRAATSGPGPVSPDVDAPWTSPARRMAEEPLPGSADRDHAARAGSAPTPILAREAPIPAAIDGPVVVTLEPVGGLRWAETPVVIRVRSLLKAAARSYGLRCTAIRRAEEAP